MTSIEIIQFRRRRGITQRELASLIGISTKSLSKLERGYRVSKSIKQAAIQYILKTKLPVNEFSGTIQNAKFLPGGHVELTITVDETHIIPIIKNGSDNLMFSNVEMKLRK
jgi:transcriptional regulator with XRE-family HTH domain